jgi:hypothetical protein
VGSVRLIEAIIDADFPDRVAASISTHHHGASSKSVWTPKHPVIRPLTAPAASWATYGEREHLHVELCVAVLPLAILGKENKPASCPDVFCEPYIELNYVLVEAWNWSKFLEGTKQKSGQKRN